ncbi:MAG TPA: cytochrome c, partial [Alphaproteobacteria bacterium]|nr:cytochrome c [Alphaproteobacteria bacterium]
MSRARFIVAGFIATTAALVAVGELAAQADKAALVKARQDEMSQMGRAFGPLGRVIRGESQNMADAVASAETMSNNAKKIVANFPADTGRDAVPDTRAKPEIW